MLLIHRIKKNIYSIIFLLYSTSVGILIFLMLFYFIEVNPVKFNNNIESRFFSFVPQGWAFFTRNPREAQIILYKKIIKIYMKKSTNVMQIFIIYSD